VKESLTTVTEASVGWVRVDQTGRCVVILGIDIRFVDIWTSG